MTSIVINGNAYSDDGSTPQDMQHYGYLTHLLPMIGDTATVAGQVATDAAQAALDAVTASNGALALRGTSTTSLAVSAGTKTLTTQTGKQFTAGNYVTISRTSAPTTLMHGVVTSYIGSTLIVEVATIAGSGTFTDWTIALSGASGEQGPSGNGVMPYVAKTGAYTVVTTDRGSLIDCTSGTFTLSFQACATLGADWSVYIRNSGTGVITFDPSGSELIDGDSTFTLYPGCSCCVQCDGGGLRKVGVYQISSFQCIHVRDEKPSGTAGGTSSSGSNTRVLNTVVINSIPGASLSSNKVTLPPGVYVFAAHAPVGIGSGAHRLNLYNYTNSSNVLTGRNTAAPSSGAAFASGNDGQFTLSVASDLELRHYISAGVATYGLGSASSTGDAEVYADLIIWKAI